MHITEGVRTIPDCQTSKRTSESVSQWRKHSEIEIWYSGMNIWLMDKSNPINTNFKSIHT